MSFETNPQKVWEEVIQKLRNLKLSPKRLGFLERAAPSLSSSEDKLILTFTNSNLSSVLEEPDLYSMVKQCIVEASSQINGFTININPNLTQSPINPVDVPAKTEDVSLEPKTEKICTLDRKTEEELSFDFTGLNPKYTFDSFVVGRNNELAHAASISASERPGQGYNPLFIYGNSGLGKTHLLHSIGNYSLEIFPHLRIKYVSSEDFTNDFINSLSIGKIRRFQEFYRRIDLLLIDDIQFLQKKQETQEAFFHTFNSLHNANRQLVITSDLPSRQLMGFEDRMRSRFEWGLSCDIQKPDLETRIAILRNKIQLDNLELSDEILNLIASQISNNVRELEGALMRVTALASLKGEVIDLETVRTLLKDFGDGDNKPNDPMEIIEIVAKRFGLTVEDICGESRTGPKSMARQIAMYLCRELTNISLPKLGAIFLRDHSTVIYSTRRISKLIQTNRDVFDHISELTQFIRNR